MSFGKEALTSFPDHLLLPLSTLWKPESSPPSYRRPGNKSSAGLEAARESWSVLYWAATPTLAPPILPPETKETLVPGRGIKIPGASFFPTWDLPGTETRGAGRGQVPQCSTPTPPSLCRQVLEDVKFPLQAYLNVKRSMKAVRGKQGGTPDPAWLPKRPTPDYCPVSSLSPQSTPGPPLTCAGGLCRGLLSSRMTCRCLRRQKETGMWEMRLQEKSRRTRGRSPSSAGG